MRYIPNSAEGQQKMLREIGVDSIEDLLKGIPDSIRLKSPLKIPAALSEAGLLEKFTDYEHKNTARVLSLHSHGDRFLNLARRILDFVHTLPGRDQPRHIASHL